MDKEIVLVAVRNNPAALQYASSSLRDDKDVVTAAVSRNGRVLEFASEKLRRNEVIVRTAVLQHKDALRHALTIDPQTLTTLLTSSNRVSRNRSLKMWIGSLIPQSSSVNR